MFEEFRYNLKRSFEEFNKMPRHYKELIGLYFWALGIMTLFIGIILLKVLFGCV